MVYLYHLYSLYSISDCYAMLYGRIQSLVAMTIGALNKCVHMMCDNVLDRADQMVLYTVKHSIDTPHKKTYMMRWVPFVGITIDKNAYIMVTLTCIRVGHTATNVVWGRRDRVFFHNCVVFKRSLCYFITYMPRMKPVADYRPLRVMTLRVGDLVDAAAVVSRIFSCIPLSANHVCTLFGVSTDNPVHVVTDEFEEITFKDTDRVN